jgi:DNA-binding MarR family transcriptional regulator
MTMTENQNAAVARAPRPAVPVGQALGQAVGQAEAALSRLLSGVVAETGTSREAYLALQRMAALGDRAARGDYARDLSESLGLDPWAAGQLADSLVSDGLLASGEGSEEKTILLTAAGEDLRGRIADSARAVSAPLLAPLDVVAVDTTIRTLQEITDRARALPSLGRAIEDGEDS